MNILILGNFFSSSRGSLPIMERVGNDLKKEFQGEIFMASTKKNKYLRLINFIFACLFRKYRIVTFDIFSSRKSFIIALVLNRIIQWKGGQLIGIFHGGRVTAFAQCNEILVRRLLSQLSLVISPSRFICTFFKEWGYEVKYIPNSINLADFPYKQQEKNIREIKLLWIRSFRDIYNPKIAVELVQLIVQKYDHVKLTMIGPDSGLLEETKALAFKLGVDQFINFKGSVPNKQLFQYFHSHNIYLNTTSYESFGVAVLEAASSGVPIISSKVGELPLLWKHEENILFTADITALAFFKQIDRLILSDGLRLRISENAREKATEFAWEKVKKYWKNLFNSNNQKTLE